MSYCRFAWDNSDVYVFGIGNNEFQCCGCLLQEHSSFYCNGQEAMIKHLLEHRKAGHVVPQHAIDRLKEELSKPSP
jgi:hypothetical protein